MDDNRTVTQEQLPCLTPAAMETPQIHLILRLIHTLIHEPSTPSTHNMGNITLCIWPHSILICSVLFYSSTVGYDH